MGVSNVEAFSGSAVDLVRDVLDVLIGEGVEVGLLGDVLAGERICKPPFSRFCQGAMRYGSCAMKAERASSEETSKAVRRAEGCVLDRGSC
jgi:hypothetical protein